MLLEYLKRKARIIILSDKKLRVATIFSGIGAPEWALKRLGVPHELVLLVITAKLNIQKMMKQ